MNERTRLLFRIILRPNFLPRVRDFAVKHRIDFKWSGSAPWPVHNIL